MHICITRGRWVNWGHEWQDWSAMLECTSWCSVADESWIIIVFNYKANNNVKDAIMAKFCSGTIYHYKYKQSFTYTHAGTHMCSHINLGPKGMISQHLPPTLGLGNVNRSFRISDQLELERLRSEDTPRRLMITHTIESCWIPSQNKVERPWRYRSRSKVITCDTPSHASNHLYQIWKESIQNYRRYRADTIFKVKAEWPWKYSSRSKVITCDTPSNANDDLCQIWKEYKQIFFSRWKPKNWKNLRKFKIFKFCY